MTGPITCATCRWFDAWPQNPTAAMGRCLHAARHGYWFAGEHHFCHDFCDVPDAAGKAEEAADAA